MELTQADVKVVNTVISSSMTTPDMVDMFRLINDAVFDFRYRDMTMDERISHAYNFARRVRWLAEELNERENSNPKQDHNNITTALDRMVKGCIYFENGVAYL